MKRYSNYVQPLKQYFIKNVIKSSRFHVKRMKTTRTIAKNISTIETAFYEECEIENVIHCNIKNCTLLLKTQKNNRIYIPVL